MLSAITSFILLTGGTKAQPIFAFLFGSLNTANWERIVLGAAVPRDRRARSSLVHARLLNVLQLDEEQASQLGVDVRAHEAHRARGCLADGGDRGRDGGSHRLCRADRAARRAAALRWRLPAAAAAGGTARRVVPHRRGRARADAAARRRRSPSASSRRSPAGRSSSTSCAHARSPTCERHRGAPRP